MPVPLTITVHVAEAVRPAVDGRRTISLGVPSTASLGDVLESLFKLYPRLLQHLASERRGTHQGLRIVTDRPAAAGQPEGLKHGQRMYLVAAPAKKKAS